ncbi:MAG: AAA family ATPase [Phycisphaeraceae bacterium]|nr:AAA family ATPase [Phycisphaeraceae bacterium]
MTAAPLGLRVVPCSVRPTERTLRACAAFGIALDRAARPRAALPSNGPRLARLVVRRLRRGGVALLTGPSGSGKSSLLRLVHSALRSHGLAVVRAAPVVPRADARAMMDLIGSSIEVAMHALGTAGLADATLWPRTPAELSEGQRWRLCLALAARRARPGACIIADEFGSTLDRTTARCVAAAFRRWVARTPGLRAVCATAHADLGDALAPRLTIDLGLDGRVRLHRGRRATP